MARLALRSNRPSAAAAAPSTVLLALAAGPTALMASARAAAARMRRRPCAAAGLLVALAVTPITRSAATVPPSALATARALQAPAVLKKKGGEFEGSEFWEEHDELLSRAWRELGPRHPDLYTFGPAFEDRYVQPQLRRAAAAARSGGGEELAWKLFHEVIPGVHASTGLFTDRFLEDMLDELEHIQSSGIPRRRPNGMNRYGVILDNVGLEAALEGLIAAYVRPLATMLFPELIGVEDADEHYAFTVRYETDGDAELAKHGDASVATLNLCLGRPGWRGGKLRFFDSGNEGIFRLPKGNDSAGSGDLDFQPGLAVIHRGQHKHQALPILAGERTNLVIWLMGKGDYVRVAPHPVAEQLTLEQRWSSPRSTFAEL